MILLDTNIILRSKQKDSLHYQEVTEKLIDLIKNGRELIVCPQVIYEFYVVATRGIAENGLGLSPEKAQEEIENILATYSMPNDNEMIFQLWQQLISTYNISGKNAHDTRIVAFMRANNISQLYTLNKADFARFKLLIDLI